MANDSSNPDQIPTQSKSQAVITKLSLQTTISKANLVIIADACYRGSPCIISSPILSTTVAVLVCLIHDAFTLLAAKKYKRQRDICKGLLHQTQVYSSVTKLVQQLILLDVSSTFHGIDVIFRKNAKGDTPSTTRELLKRFI